MTPNAVPSRGPPERTPATRPAARLRRPEVPPAAGTDAGDAAVHRTVMPVMKFEYVRFGSPLSFGRVVSRTESP